MSKGVSRLEKRHKSGEKRFSEEDLTIEAYLYALALENLSSLSHEQRNLMMRMSDQDLMQDAFDRASTKLHNMAREIFPLYPHPDFMMGHDFLQKNGYEQ